MPLQTYDSFELLGMVESLENDPVTFLRDRYFPTEMTFDTEEVHFDVIDKARRLAPFVSPLVEGKLVETQGYTTRFFRPAYVKPKHVIKPTDTLKRRAGESFGGTLTLQQRRAALVVQALAEHRDMLDMREEVMAAEIARTGKVTIAGEGFSPVVVDFNRDAALTVTLTGGDRWSQSTGTPLLDLEAWALLVRQKSNTIVRDVIMTPDAWTALKARLSEAERAMLFDSLRGSVSRIELGPRLQQKIQFQGVIGEFNFWTYSETYSDDDGNTQDVLPSGTVLLTSPGLEGVRAYGAILDIEALRPFRIWPKMWQQPDPSVEYVLSQSAPLLAPLRPNASLGASVL